MGKDYGIRRVASGDISKYIWDDMSSAAIDCYPWNENGYTPRAEAKVIASEREFHVLLRAYENTIRAECENLNDYVCGDSCVEFFLNPNPDSDNRYFNFEFNPLGTAYLSVGKDRYNRKLLGDKEWCLLNICSSVTKASIRNFDRSYWDIKFVIPFTLIEDNYGKINFYSGKKLRGNFYKCGDYTAFPHYGCWNPIVFSTPDFHRPEYFGNLFIE